MPKKIRSGISGFTLIELLVVISIISLLSSVVLSNLTSARLKAHDARRFSDLHQLYLILEEYAADNGGNYPPIAADSRGSNWSSLQTYLAPYLPALPLDPANGSGEGAMCGNCGEYYYSAVLNNGVGTGYILSTYLAISQAQKSGINQYGPYFSIHSNCSSAAYYNITPSLDNGFWYCQ